MTSAPLVSVVTPVHNGAEFLAECVDSVLTQTYANWNFTIVDNASTDATPEIASRYAAIDSRIRHLRFDELVDVTASYNRAFESVDPESEFCKVVGADDMLFPECLERMVAAASVSETRGDGQRVPALGQETCPPPRPPSHDHVRPRDGDPPRIAARRVQRYGRAECDDAPVGVRA